MFDYLYQIERLVPILLSRINAVGLVEACQSIVGPFKDRSKHLVVASLASMSRRKRARWGTPTNAEASSSSGCQTDYDYNYDNEPCWVVYEDDFLDDDDPPKPLPHPSVFCLKPYVDGKKQEPLPQTSYLYMRYLKIQEPSWDGVKTVTGCLEV